jgi:hypothetical protein
MRVLLNSLGITLEEGAKRVLRHSPGYSWIMSATRPKEDRYAEGGAAAFQASGSRARSPWH